MKSAVRPISSDELSIINQYFSKKELKPEDVYVFSVDAADNYSLTSYFSRLGSDMIEGFHRDVMSRREDPETELIGYLFGHNTHEIPSGTLFSSEVVNVQEGESKLSAFHPSVYMAKGITSGGISTDDYIKAYEAGHTEAVSVGFQAGAFTCDLCGNDMRSMLCPHMPGANYNMAKEDEKPDMKQCTYTVHQGKITSRNLIELSGVYAGAMPGKRVKGEFSLPENSPLQVKDGKVVDGSGGIFASTSIKDFKEGDILRFNFQFDGSIEKVGETEMTSEEVKAILDKVKKAEDEALRLQQALDSQKTLLDKVQADLELVKTELEKEKKDHGLTVANLVTSQVDQVDLQKKIDGADKKIKKLEAELQAKAVIADAFVKDLKDRCSKLSIQINGMNHKPEIFDKEVANLSIEDLKTKIEGYEKQLAQMIPTGRQTEFKLKDGTENGKQPSNTVTNKNVFKFKKN